MRCFYIVNDNIDLSIRDMIDQWIEENEEDILEILNIQIDKSEDLEKAIIFYIERNN